MPDAVNGQTDFGAGIYRGREAPENAVYDAVNLLIDDEGQLLRRGGSAYRSTADAGSTLLGLADAYTAAGRRTLAWGPTGLDTYVLSAANAPLVVPPHSAGGGGFPLDSPLLPAGRITAAGGFLVLPATPGTGLGSAFIYAGSLKPSNYSGAGTIATTEGSPIVTGTGTTFAANIDTGMIFVGGTSADPGAGMVIPVASVQGDTSLTLTRPATATISGAVPRFHVKLVLSVAFSVRTYWASVANRVVWTLGTKAYFSDPFDLFTNALFAFPIPTGYPDQYHELPTDAVIFGAESIRDSLILFTATGVWAISQLDFDPIDDMGNIQHRVEQINKDLILWGDAGISAYAGTLIVPGLEDIVLLDAAGGIQVISQAIRPLYRSYVKAGYQPGVAVVHRGHYFLPVLNGTTIVDVLVCRIDRGTAWTRFSGHAASASYAQRVGEPSRAPLLLGISGQRVTNLSDCFEPSASNPSDADGATHPIAIETRDYITPGRRTGSTTETLRLRYEAVNLSGGSVPYSTISAAFARHEEAAAYEWLTTLIGGRDSNGSSESVWRVGKRAPSIRFRVSSTSAMTFKLRSLEAPWRRST